MKTSQMLIIALVIVSCNWSALFFSNYQKSVKTVANLSTDIPVVREKTQNWYQRKNGESLYLITCYGKDTAEPKYQFRVILPENFAELNQHIYFRGSNMFAGPMEMETR